VLLSGRRGGFELLLPAGVAVAILCFAFGSAGVTQLSHFGGTVRWIALTAVLALALAACVRDGLRAPCLHDLVAGALVLTAAVSASWSVDASLTLQRAVSLALLFGTAAAVVAWAGVRPGRAALVPAGVVAGSVAVVVAGYVLYAIDPGAALQAQGVGQAWRFRGIGQNPNTVSMLAAVAIPVTVVGIAASRRSALRFAAAVALVLLAVEIGLSGSRGAAVAAVLGAGCGALLAPGARRARVAVLAAALALLAGSAAVENRLGNQASPPAVQVSAAPVSSAGISGSQAASAPAAPLAPGAPGYDVLKPTPFGACKQEDEIGRPQPGDASGAAASAGITSSGRVAAWRVALQQSLQRPVVGYGFGTEERVFYSCFYSFEGARPESTYLGVFLQLGAVGVALLVSLVIALAFSIVRVLRYGGTEARSIAAVSAGALVVGLVLMLVQSYALSVGNTATAALWLCAAAGAGLGAPRLGSCGKPFALGAVVFATVALCALVLLGRSESQAQVHDELRGLARTRAAVGRLDSPALSALRPSGDYRCLAYRRGMQTFALELCFDRRGRLLEASDRRGKAARVYTLRLDPDAATLILPLDRANATAEKVRRRVTVGIWAGPTQNLRYCRVFANEARHAPAARRRRKVERASSWCRGVALAVSNDARSAGVVGSPAVRAAALSVASILATTADSLAELAQHLDAEGLAAYDARVTSLRRRVELTFRNLKTREPWLRMSG
jgi:hypothetical protein